MLVCHKKSRFYSGAAQNTQHLISLFRLFIHKLEGFQDYVAYLSVVLCTALRNHQANKTKHDSSHKAGKFYCT